MIEHKLMQTIQPEDLILQLNFWEDFYYVNYHGVQEVLDAS